ncbi:MAG: apolipoprotein N-acyltransferase [Nitrospira sp.]|nr:apolipoprotein N-acyltransferase [bacterium]MBL7049667.1 apolipoprotein N-acyltransferase [Nitrospira sp.]
MKTLNSEMTKNSRTDYLLSALSGLLLILSFPPLNLYLLAWIGLVPLLIALRDKNSRSSFTLGLLTGLIYFLGTVYFVYNSMAMYGHLGAAVSVLLTLLLCSYLALYLGAFALLFNYVSSRSAGYGIISVPVIWVAFEYIRTHALTGYPWSLLAHSQHAFLSVIQIADITGVYGVSFLVAGFSALVYAILHYGRACKGRVLLSIALYLVLLADSLFYGYERTNEAQHGNFVRVGIVQGNIEQDRKWDSRFQQESIEKYRRLTLDLMKDRPDLIVWPETALPFIFDYDAELTDGIMEFQRELNSWLLLGSVMLRDGEHVTNSAILLNPEGTEASVYDKIHLVPYGEYVPFKELLPFVKKLTAGVGDFQRGGSYSVMKTPNAAIGSLICYEIIFPDLVRRFVDNGANLIVNITNDAWFGRTSAPYQHFAIAVFRAVENRVPVARAANTGISGFIDSRGRIIRKSGIFTETGMTEVLRLGSGSKSIYTRYGDVFAGLCLAGLIIIAAGAYISDRRKKR